MTTVWPLILIPFVAGALAFLLRSKGLRRGVLITTAAIHLGLSVVTWVKFEGAVDDSWLAVDSLSLLFLTTTSLLFAAAAIYAVGYLRRETDRADAEPHGSEAVFTGCMLLFLGSMTLVTLSRHLGVLWVGVEATTLSSAPLIYFHRHQRSLEATWKYLLICSVGIALALLGNFFLAVSTFAGSGGQLHLTVDQLTQHAAVLDPIWLKAAFLLLLVGYGTKMGLAPMHTWLPDAHSEAPAVVSALLSGALLNCAFVGILRVLTVLSAAGLGDFGRAQLLLFGLLSMAVAALMLVTQTDFKRMLAYSSIEHMGVMALGIGLGAAAGVGGLFHACNHSLTKAALFLTAGNILAMYRTKKSEAVTGMFRRSPLTAVLWLGGGLAIVGSPPFGLFASELMILKGAVSGGHWWIAGGYLASLAVAMAAISYRMFPMVFGAASRSLERETARQWFALPALVMIVFVFILGLWAPSWLTTVLRTASQTVLGT
jgi:hydrogenase-4 component F